MKRSLLIVFMSTFLAVVTSNAQNDRYWVASTDGNWSDPASWAVTSGGAGGAGFPGADGRAIFDGANSKSGNCNIDIPIDVAGISVEANYEGSINQFSGQSVSVGEYGFIIQNTGLFVGSDAPITIKGNLNIGSSTFISTSSLLDIHGDFNSQGSYRASTGIIRLHSGNKINGYPRFHHAEFVGEGGGFTIMGAINIHGNMLFTGNVGAEFNGGRILIEGDLKITNTGTEQGGGTTGILVGYFASAPTRIIHTGEMGQGVIPGIWITNFFGVEVTGNLRIRGAFFAEVNGLSGFSNNDFTMASDFSNANIELENLPGRTMMLANNINFSNVTFRGVNNGLYQFTPNNPLAGASGDVIIEEGATLEFRHSSMRFSVGGDWINRGTFRENTTTVIFNGTDAQQVTNSIDRSFYNIVVDNSGGILLTEEVFVRDSFIFSQGVVSGDVAFDDDAVAVGGSSISYIDGTVTKTGDDPFTFPTGNAGNYQPVTISAPAGIADSIIAKYSRSSTGLETKTSDSIGYVSHCEHWTLYGNADASNINVVLGWNEKSCNEIDTTTLTIARFNGYEWVDQGSTQIFGEHARGTIRSGSLNGYGAFALANISKCDLEVSVGNDMSVCKGDELTLDAIITGGTAPYEIEWSTGDTGSAITLLAVVNGYYKAIVTDALGCTSEDSIFVVVNDLPEVNISPDSIINLCKIRNERQVEELNAGSIPGASYLWTTGETTNTISVNTAGMFGVTVTDTNGCSAIDIVKVNVLNFQAPGVFAGEDRTINCGESVQLGSPGQGIGKGNDNLEKGGGKGKDNPDPGAHPHYTYSWTAGSTLNNPLSSRPVATPNETTRYTLKVVNNYGCYNTDEVEITVNCLGINKRENNIAAETEEEISVSLYPNPGSGIFKLNTNMKSVERGRIMVTDIRGNQVLLVKDGIINNKTITVDMTGKPQGTYFVSLVSESASVMKPLALVR